MSKYEVVNKRRAQRERRNFLTAIFAAGLVGFYAGIGLAIYLWRGM